MKNLTKLMERILDVPQDSETPFDMVSPTS